MAAVSAATDLTASGLRTTACSTWLSLLLHYLQTREQAMADFLALSVFGDAHDALSTSGLGRDHQN
jgi:hypothetical protein